MSVTTCLLCFELYQNNRSQRYPGTCSQPICTSLFTKDLHVYLSFCISRWILSLKKSIKTSKCIFILNVSPIFSHHVSCRRCIEKCRTHMHVTTDVPHWVGTGSGKDNKIRDPCLTSQAEGRCKQLFIAVRLLVEKLEPVVLQHNLKASQLSCEEVVCANRNKQRLCLHPIVSIHTGSVQTLVLFCNFP